jgi:hypothetical protein
LAISNPIIQFWSFKKIEELDECPVSTIFLFGKGMGQILKLGNVNILTILLNRII